MIYYLRNNHKELPEQTGKYVSILYCEKCDVYNIEEIELSAITTYTEYLSSIRKIIMCIVPFYSNVRLASFLSGECSIKSCPFCSSRGIHSFGFVNASDFLGSLLDSLKGYKYYCDTIKDIKKKATNPYEIINERFKDMENNAKNQVSSFVNKCEKIEYPLFRIESTDAIDLKNYLLTLTQIEGTILSTSRRLSDLLYRLEQLTIEEKFHKRIFSLKKEQEREEECERKLEHYRKKNEKLKKEKEKYEKILRLNNKKYKAAISEFSEEINLKDIALIYPRRPTSIRMHFPDEPKLSSPYFLFKNRNAHLIEEYDNRWKEIQTKKEDYLNEMAHFIKNVKCAKENQLLMYEKAQEKQKRKIDYAKFEKEKVDKEYSTLINNINSSIKENMATCRKIRADSKNYDATPIETPENARIKLVNDEIKQAKQLLKKLIVVRNSLYSLDIVFEKYRNYVAVATFYEYILSGRCDTLKGSNGAYNLYENEIRMNTVISQLEQVIESLKSIKKCQYMLYISISDMNEELKELNCTMDKIASYTKSISFDSSVTIKKLSSIMDATSSIAGNTSSIAKNTSVTAYNTARTAFYSKRNAELTNALGYLAAFKL